MIAYLAGPEVFLPDAVEQGERKKAICAKYGITGLFPFDNQIDITQPDASKLIFDANHEMIAKADIIIANLTPYPLGVPSADVGTVWELGCAYGLGKPCYAFTNDPRGFETRFKAYLQEIGINPATEMAIEQFDNTDNLMIDESIGHIDVGTILPEGDALELYYRDLTAFERCVQKITADRRLEQSREARQESGSRHARDVKFNKASIELRRELFGVLKVPLGSASIIRRATDEGDIMVVRMESANTVSSDRRIHEYDGFKVIYEVRAPIHAGPAR